MTRKDEFNAAEAAMQLISEQGEEAFAEAFRIIVNEAMRIERSRALGAGPYERSEDRLGYANGYKPKTVSTRLGRIQFDIPQVRPSAEAGEIDFYPSAFERGLRSERALKLAVAEMYVQGVSTRKVTEVMKKLCGLEVTSTEVSRAARMLDEHIAEWLSRPIGEVAYLLVDARYEKVRWGGRVVSCAVLIAVGVMADGRREILGVSVSLSEAEVHWREFFANLQARGLHGVKMITSDDHAGLGAALKARFPGVPWQRCQFHLQRNAMAHVPRQSMRGELAADLRSVFDAPDLSEATRHLGLIVEKYRPTLPDLADWLEENVPESLTVFALPRGHRRRLRTTNMLELLNKEIKRRTRVASLFPNEASLLRLVAAILIETHEDWQSQPRYLNLNMKPENQTT